MNRLNEQSSRKVNELCVKWLIFAWNKGNQTDVQLVISIRLGFFILSRFGLLLLQVRTIWTTGEARRAEFHFFVRTDFNCVFWCFKRVMRAGWELARHENLSENGKILPPFESIRQSGGRFRSESNTGDELRWVGTRRHLISFLAKKIMRREAVSSKCNFILRDILIGAIFYIMHTRREDIDSQQQSRLGDGRPFVLGILWSTFWLTLSPRNSIPILIRRLRFTR
jgi:hypothetical protein